MVTFGRVVRFYRNGVITIRIGSCPPNSGSGEFATIDAAPLRAQGIAIRMGDRIRLTESAGGLLISLTRVERS